MPANLGPTDMVSIGRTKVSRLIVGHNPVCANSHVSDAMNQEMREYFTPDNVLAMYKRAEELGIKAYLVRGDYQRLGLMELYLRAGGRMTAIAQTASEMHDIFSNIRVLAAAGITAIYHHGTQTDRFWNAGRIDDCLDYLKCMRDCGVDVGLCTHNPDVIDYAQQHAWDVDFYMASFYNLSRVQRQSAIITGKGSYSEEEYLDADRDAMTRMILSVDKPVLAFKVLAATRKCATQQDVREAFRYTYANIKPTDAVIVGFYPRYQDQLALDIQYVQEAISGGCRTA